MIIIVTSTQSETADLWEMSVENVRRNVYAQFRCAPLCIKKALGIFRELITTTTTTTTTRTTTRVAVLDPPPGSKNITFDAVT